MFGAQRRLGELGEAADLWAGRFTADVLPRVLDRDHTVFQDDPTEVADRLGWLDLPADFRPRVAEIEDVVEDVVRAGLSYAVVIGMGGSSLFPEVMSNTFGPRDDRLEVVVLDSTDPRAVRRVERELPLEETLFIVSSKSGSTIETRSHLDHFWARMEQAVSRAGKHFVAITDPGSELEGLARERQFRHVFLNPPDVGGRFSALSYFGLVPAALLGVDVDELLDRALDMRAMSEANDPAKNPSVGLAAVLAAAAEVGRDKLTLLFPPAIRSFGDWIEQLVAESTGKHGKGILPVVGERVHDPDAYGDDRLFVAYGNVGGLDALVQAGHPVLELPFGDRHDLGGEVYRWELATALVGVALDINPFDQPDVQAAKVAAGQVLDGGVPDIEEVDPAVVLDSVAPGDFVAITAFVYPMGSVVEDLERVAAAIRGRNRVATTVGIGPRYLHSTGQLHKGKPQQAVVLQVVGDDPDDVEIPGRTYTFGQLKQAQAAGDYAALRDAGARVARVSIGDLLALAD